MFTQVTARLVSRLKPAHVAETDQERAAIFRLRYDVYVREQREDNPYADHDKQELRSPEDDSPDATLFYVGHARQPVATLRVRVWKPQQIPDEIFEQYSLERFPDIATRTVCEVTYLISGKTARGSANVVALTSGAIDHTIRNHCPELLIADCVPGLLDAYRRLGLRPYGGRLIEFAGGSLVPVAAVVADLDHARTVQSPWYPTLKKLAADRALPTRDHSFLSQQFEGGGGVESDAERISNELDDAFSAKRSTFLERLPERARARLRHSGVILDVHPGTYVVRENFVDRELFLPLEGVFEVLENDQVVATMGPGELFGEVAFLLESGQRSASVRAATEGRVLVLRRKFLERLKTDQPAEAIAILETLAAILAERFSASRRSGSG